MSDPEDLLELIHAARRIRSVRFTAIRLGSEYAVHVLDGRARVESRSDGAISVGAGRRWRRLAADGYGEQRTSPPFDPALVLGTPALLSCHIEVLGSDMVAGRRAHHIHATPFRWIVPPGGGSMGEDRVVELWLDAGLGVALRGEWGEVTSIAFDEPLSPGLFVDPIPAGVPVIDRRQPPQPRPMTIDQLRAFVRFPLLIPGLLPEGARLSGAGAGPEGAWAELRYAVPPGARYMLTVCLWPAGGGEPQGPWGGARWSRERHDGVEVDVVHSRDNHVRVERGEVEAVLSSALPVSVLARMAGSLRSA